MHLHTFPDIPIPNISISSTTHMISGLSIAALVGQRLQLTCNVMVLEHLVVTPSVLWTGINLPTDETLETSSQMRLYFQLSKNQTLVHMCVMLLSQST